MTLLALDLAGVFLAIFTALLLKDVVRSQGTAAGAFHQTRDIVAFAGLVTVLLFARSDMYADRGERPGFARILATLFQVTVVALLFAVVSGRRSTSTPTTSSTARSSSRWSYLGTFRYLYEQVSGLLLRAAGYRRRAVLVGSAKTIDALAKALGTGPRTRGRGRRLRVAHPARRATACGRSARSRRSAR